MRNETNNATYTPGPWHIQDNTAYPYGQLLVASAVHGAVSICYTMEKGESRAPAEYIQNARLISAAPELLEALRELITQIYEDVPNETVTDHFRDALIAAESAVKKATGGEQ